MYNSPNVIYWKYMYNTCTTVYTCKTGRDFIRLLRASFHKSSVINNWASKMWQMISVPVWLTYKTETCLLSRGRFFFLDYIDGYPHIQLNGIWVYILNQMYTFPNQTWFSWLKKKANLSTCLIMFTVCPWSVHEKNLLDVFTFMHGYKF